MNWDGYDESICGWGEDFIATEAEYNGRLSEEECDYCYRGLLYEERLYKTKRNGRVCVDCRDIIREIEAEEDGE